MSKPANKSSALAQLGARIAPAPAVNAPRVASFRQFLLEVARVRVQSGAAAGTYAPYTFKGRAALEEIVGCIDHVLGSFTGEPLKDSRLALAGGAQFGKTTLELALAAYAAACRFLNPIVFLPDDKLADEIVDAKFRPDVLDQIPWLAAMTKVGRAVNESGKAVNTKGAFLVTDGQRKAVGMFRGLQKPPTTFTADIVIEDEKDDIKRANSKFVSGRMTASALRFHLEVGTQRLHGAGQNAVWKNGSQGVVLLASARVREQLPHDAFKIAHGHRYTETVPPGWINPEDAWPQICRCAITGTPRRDDPVLGFEGDFRRAGSTEVVATFTPGGHYYYAHPETGEPLDCDHPLWHHRVPAKLAQRQFSFRVAQIGTLAIDLAQIVAHWTRAVADNEEMVTFRCDRQALPKSAAQALTPEIMSRARDEYFFGEKRAGVPRFAGLDMGDRCWYVCRETAHAGDKRLVSAAQIAIGDVVGRALALCAADGVSTLFIDERPAVSEARTLALALNGLAELDHWPSIDWRDRSAYVALPSGLAWDGRNQKWIGLRCAVVRFTKNQLGAGLEQGGVEFTENGVTKFVPVIACNRFETIDRVVRELLTPTENVVEVVRDAEGKNHVRTAPALRLPRLTPGAPAILSAVDAHFLAGSQRVKDDKTGELGDYIDGVDNHLLFAAGYSALAETIGGTAKAAAFHYERLELTGTGREGSIV
ncbi:MAG: hypothetical protein JNK23_10580 [Opitutaceae bacterium]|nr:hypothetical protein [Opitutaceae bacterium]